MTWLLRIDDAFIKWTIAAYLWILDWTGVYVGTISMTLMVLDVAWDAVVLGRITNWFLPGVMLTVMGLWSLGKWSLQHRGMNVKFNAGALAYQAHVVRYGIVVSEVACLLITAIEHGWKHGISWSWIIAWNYVACVTIRDREPREFKLGRVLRPAMGGTR